jgi:hypothetical protein
MEESRKTTWRVDGPGNRQYASDSLRRARDEVRYLFDLFPDLASVNLVRITEDPTSVSRRELPILNRAFPVSEKEELQAELFDINELLGEGDRQALADPAGIAGRRKLKIIDRLKEINAIASLEAELKDLDETVAERGDDGPADVFADRRRAIVQDLQDLERKKGSNE